MELSQAEIDNTITLWNEKNADIGRIMEELEPAEKCIEILKILMSKNMIKEKSLCFPTVDWKVSESVVRDYKFLEIIKPYVREEEFKVEDYMDYKDKEYCRVLLNNYTFSNVIDDILDEDDIGHNIDIVKERFEILEYCNIPLPVINIVKILFIDYYDRPFRYALTDYLILDYKVQDKVGLYQLFTAIMKECIIDDITSYRLISDLIQACIQHKIVTKESSRKYNYFLHFLKEEHLRDDIEKLLEMGMTIDHLDKDGNNVIFYADNKVISFYVNMWVDVHHVNHEGKNAMFYVRNERDIKTLISYNVNPLVNQPFLFKKRKMYREYKREILDYSDTRIYIINCLVQLGDMNINIDRKGNGILAYIHDDTLRSRLIAKGCDPNKRNNKGRTTHEQRMIKANKINIIVDPYKTLKKYMDLNEVAVCKAMIDRMGDINKLIYSNGKDYTLFSMLIINYVHDVADNDIEPSPHASGGKIREIMQYFINKRELKLDGFEDYMNNWRMYDDANETIAKMVKNRVISEY